MKGVFKFILSHSIFLAFCAAALSLQTLQLLALPLNGYLAAFIFFAALAGYNAYWMVSKFAFSADSSLIFILQKSRSSFLVMLLAITGMGYCMTKLHLVMYNIFLTIILLGLYSMSVMPFKRLYFSKKAGVLKTILLAFTWTIVTTLIPLQISILDMGHAALLIFINRFLFMLMLCIIFDKRDAVIDKIRGLQSLATHIKPPLLHFLMVFIFTCHAWITYLMKLYGVPGLQVAALMVTGVVTLFVYIISLKNKGYLFYYFLVDGLMFLSALLTGLAGFFSIQGDK